MRTWLATTALRSRGFGKVLTAALAWFTLSASSAFAQSADEAGGEASLKLPDLSSGVVSWHGWPQTADDRTFFSACSGWVLA